MFAMAKAGRAGTVQGVVILSRATRVAPLRAGRMQTSSAVAMEKKPLRAIYQYPKKRTLVEIHTQE
jgi:hypothetical protein